MKVENFEFEMGQSRVAGYVRIGMVFLVARYKITVTTEDLPFWVRARRVLLSYNDEDGDRDGLEEPQAFSPLTMSVLF